MTAKRAMIELSPHYADRVARSEDGVDVETVLPLAVALPLIVLMSLTLWAALWRLGSWIFTALA